VQALKRIVVSVKHQPEIWVGLYRYAHPHVNWMCESVTTRGLHAVVSRIKRIGADGCILTWHHAEPVPGLAETGVPCVHISDTDLGPRFPCVAADNVAIGRMAANYLADLGLRNLAYFSPERASFCPGRLKGFLSTARQRETTTNVFTRRGRYRPVNMNFQLRPDFLPSMYNWIAALPKPVGILACDDERGMWLTRICAQLGLSVPGDVAILGPENTELSCLIAHPALSSIRLPKRRIVYEAARMLDRLMAGEPLTTSRLLFEPLGVVERGSTDATYADNPEIVAALQLIHRKACTGLRADDVIHALPGSRRRITDQFRASTGRSILEEIIRVRISRAKEMLRADELPLKRIATRCGYANTSAFSRDFRKRVGQPPGAWRSAAKRERQYWRADADEPE
jgi:LacI family transcriptional regulator, galactose operon repressor